MKFFNTTIPSVEGVIDYPQIFDMDEDLMIESQNVEIPNVPEPSSPQGVESIDIIESFFSLPIVQCENHIPIDIEEENNEDTFSLEEESIEIIPERVSLASDGLFFPQPIMPSPQTSMLSSILAEAKSSEQPLYMIYNNFFVRRTLWLRVMDELLFVLTKTGFSGTVSIVPGIFWLEVLEELFCYRIHHQIGRFRDIFDDVLQELQDREASIEGNISEILRSYDSSRSSSPGF